jgi:hypothetical protein
MRLWKNCPKCCPTELVHNYYHRKSCIKFWATSEIFQKLTKENSCPRGENSPNLVTWKVGRRARMPGSRDRGRRFGLGRPSGVPRRPPTSRGRKRRPRTARPKSLVSFFLRPSRAKTMMYFLWTVGQQSEQSEKTSFLFTQIYSSLSFLMISGFFSFVRTQLMYICTNYVHICITLSLEQTWEDWMFTVQILYAFEFQQQWSKSFIIRVKYSIR